MNHSCNAKGILLTAAMWLTLTGAPLLAESPTTYVPAVSDVFVCNSASANISVLNGVTQQYMDTIWLPVGAKPFCIAFTPNYSKAYVSDNGNGKIYVLRDDLTLQKTIKTKATSATAIQIEPEGNFAYISSSVGVMVLDTQSTGSFANSVFATISMDFPGAIVFTPDGSRAYVTVDGNFGSISQVKVVDTVSHSVAATIQLPVPTAPLDVAATPDGTRVYVAGWVAHNVSVINSDPASQVYNTVTAVIPVSGPARGIALSPSGDLAYVALDTGGVDVIVTAPSSNQFHQVIAHIPGASGSIHELALSLDGRFVYSWGGFNSLDVIDSEPLSAKFNSVVGRLAVGGTPFGIAVRPHR